MIPLDSIDALDDALAARRAVLYKHSSRCGLSYLARREVRKFAENFPDARVFVVDVIGNREVSDAVETRLGVRHESPQAVLLRDGRAAAHASHRGVRAGKLAAWWTDSVDPDDPG